MRVKESECERGKIEERRMEKVQGDGGIGRRIGEEERRGKSEGERVRKNTEVYRDRERKRGRRDRERGERKEMRDG